MRSLLLSHSGTHSRTQTNCKEALRLWGSGAYRADGIETSQSPKPHRKVRQDRKLRLLDRVYVLDSEGEDAGGMEI